MVNRIFFLAVIFFLLILIPSALARVELDELLGNSNDQFKIRVQAFVDEGTCESTGTISNLVFLHPRMLQWKFEVENDGFVYGGTWRVSDVLITNKTSSSIFLTTTFEVDNKPIEDTGAYCSQAYANLITPFLINVIGVYNLNPVPGDPDPIDNSGSFFDFNLIEWVTQNWLIILIAVILLIVLVIGVIRLLI